MHASRTLGDESITTIRFRADSTAGRVTACLREAARQADLTLLALERDGKPVFPFETGNPARSPSSWLARLLRHEDASGRTWHLDALLRRVELSLDIQGGVRIERHTPRWSGSGRRPKSRSGSGLGHPREASPTGLLL